MPEQPKNVEATDALVLKNDSSRYKSRRSQPDTREGNLRGERRPDIGLVLRRRRIVRISTRHIHNVREHRLEHEARRNSTTFQGSSPADKNDCIESENRRQNKTEFVIE